MGIAKVNLVLSLPMSSDDPDALLPVASTDEEKEEVKECIPPVKRWQNFIKRNVGNNLNRLREQSPRFNSLMVISERVAYNLRGSHIPFICYINAGTLLQRMSLGRTFI